MKKKVLIVTASYYSDITRSLRTEAELLLKKSKIKFNVINVPGVFEIPLMIAKNIKKYDGFIALGCVIKGETPHFEFISKTTFEGLMKLSIDNKKPIGNGIITSLIFNRQYKDLEQVKRKTKVKKQQKQLYLYYLKNENLL